MNKKRKISLFIGLLVVLVIGVIIWCFYNASQESAEYIEEELPKELEEYMTVNLFPGFSGEAASDVVDGSLSHEEVLLEYAGSYDGIFYEDGKNEEKEQVFSLIITNVAPETLEVMQLWIEDENGESYQFQLSALPSGGTVLIQELSGKQFREEGSYTIVRDSFGFLEPDPNLEDIEVQETNGKIYITNSAPTEVRAVQIIYKNWMKNHVYLGGIAYQIPLEKIAAGETLEIRADHYQDGGSKVTGMKQSLAPEGGADAESAN